MVRITSGLVVLAVLVFSLCGASAVHAGGMPMPRIQEERVEPEERAEAVQKMPVFEYEESKMPADEQPAGVKEKTWVWVLLGFVAAIFVTSL